jgi:hypothetical protein
MNFTGAAANQSEKPETDAEFEARMNAILAASPKSRAIWEDFQDTVAAGNRRLSDALRRAGFDGEINWQTLMAAWRSAGFSVEDFGRLQPRDLIEVLEAKANVLERIRDRGNPTSELLRKKAGLTGGRPRKSGIDGATIRAARGELSQRAFARLCKISIEALHRAENDGGSSFDTMTKIGKRLKKIPQKKQPH